MRRMITGSLAGAALLVAATGASAQEVPSAVSQFDWTARQLASSPRDPMHPATVAAMRDMASALRAIPGIPDEHAQTIEAQANAIEHSRRTSHMHEDAAKQALQAALEGLSSLPRCGALDAKLTSARASVRRINEDVLFLKQKNTIDTAFVDVAGAIGAASTCRREVATIPSQERLPVVGEEGKVYHLRLKRGLFDSVGQKANFQELCGEAGVARVEPGRTAGDVAAGVFTAGFYTPSHMTVTCNPRWVRP